MINSEKNKIIKGKYKNRKLLKLNPAILTMQKKRITLHKWVEFLENQLIYQDQEPRNELS